MSATPPQLPSLLLTDLPAETLSAIVLLLRPIDALRFSQTCQPLRELATVNDHSLWALYVNKAGTERHSPVPLAVPAPAPATAPIADALHDFLSLVKQNTCSPEHKWHPSAAKASNNSQIDACEACIDARLYTSAETLGSDVQQALLERALKREGISLRSDSRLCSGFIYSGHGYIPDIVQTMVRMHIIYAHSIMTEIVHNHLDALRDAYSDGSEGCYSDEEGYHYKRRRPHLTAGDKASLEHLAYSWYTKVLKEDDSKSLNICPCGRPSTKERIRRHRASK